jgi:hypothetical protein
MDRNSFIYEDGSMMKGEYFYCDVNAVDDVADFDLVLSQLTESHVQFRNIQIRGAMLNLGDPNYWSVMDSSPLYLENFFEPPMLSLDGQTLYLWPKTDERGYPLLITKGIMTVYNTHQSSSGADVFAQDLGNGWYFNIKVDVIINGQARDAAGIPLGRRGVMSYKTYGISERKNYNGADAWTPLSDPDYPFLPAVNMAVAIKAENVKPGIDPGDFVTDLRNSELIKGAPGINPGSNVISGAPGPGNWIYLAFTSQPTRAKVSGAIIWEHPYWRPEISNEVIHAEDLDISYQAKNFVEAGWHTHPQTADGTGSLVEVIDTGSPEYQAIHKALSQKSNYSMMGGAYPLYVVKYQLHPGMEALFQEDTNYDPPIPKMIDLYIAAVTNWDESYLAFTNDKNEGFYKDWADPNSSGYYNYGNWLVDYNNHVIPYNSTVRDQPHGFFNLGSFTGDPAPPNSHGSWGAYWEVPLVGRRWMMFEYDY